MLADHYSSILTVHVTCVSLSGTLFTCRGVLRLAKSRLANVASLRWASHVIDTALLAAALLLMPIVHQYPFVNAWLTAKVLMLIAYVVLGSLALHRARTQHGRALAFALALLTFAAIVGAAVTKRPAGWLSLLHG